MATESRERRLEQASNPRRHPPQSSSSSTYLICTANQVYESRMDERLTKLEAQFEECQTFPADIEYEILLRLPVKTLCRFKCSSKSWYSLISSPQFQNHHFTRSQKKPLLLTIRDDDEDAATLRFCRRTNTKEGTVLNTFSKHLPVPVHCDDVFPICSCMGLVCLATMQNGFTSEEEDITPSILICNPSTEEIIILPQFQEPTTRIGFGYAATSQEFKVFRFFIEEDSNDYICDVFTLGTSDWREVKNPPLTSEGAETPFFHGALHIFPSASSYPKEMDKIAALDVETEEYKWIALPESYHRLASTPSCMEDFKEFCLKELGGSLWLTYYLEKTKLLHLWLLKDYKNGDWVEGYHIDLSSLANIRRTIWTGVVGIWTGVVGVMGDGSVLMTVLADGVIKLLSYDPRGEIREIDQVFSAKLYVETFYSLGSR